MTTASSSAQSPSSVQPAPEHPPTPVSPKTSPSVTVIGWREWWSGSASLTGDGFSDRSLQVFVILAAALLYLPRLQFGLWDCWEPHYAEAARMMVVRKDWLHPFWSYAYFLSKPILMFWYMAASISVFGMNEWAIRLPFALHAVLMVWAVYFFVSRLFTRRAGILAAAVVATSPLSVFLGRQAMADILVVTYLTMALGFFALAVFGSRQERDAAILEQRNPRIHLPFLYLFYALMGLTLLAKGLLGAGLAGLVIVGYLLLSQDWLLLQRVRLFSGIAVALVIALPWYLHMITFPGRNIDDGKTFWDRFILHDNVYRLFRGVHGERGHFSYFVHQLGYAMGLWIGIVPIAVLGVARWRQVHPDPHEKLTRFFFAWWFFLLLFFSLSQTKFHHYVFPLIPISGILVGIWLDKFLTQERNPLYDVSILLAATIFLVVVRDILNDPLHLVNMFVYKYSRPYPWSDPMFLFGNAWSFQKINLLFFTVHLKQIIYPLTPQNIIAFFTFSAFAFYLVSVLKFFSRQVVVGGLVCVGLLWSMYYGQFWMPMLAKHWSQQGIFETLKKDSPLWRRLLSNPYADALQEDVPDEPLFAFRMNWRGEKFYSRNRDIQVMNHNSYRRMHEALERLRKPGRPVYFLIEAGRMAELRRAVGYYDSRRLHVIDRSNNKYLLLRLNPRPAREYQSPYQLRIDEDTRNRYDNWNAKRLREQRKQNQQQKSWQKAKPRPAVRPNRPNRPNKQGVQPTHSPRQQDNRSPQQHPMNRPEQPVRPTPGNKQPLFSTQPSSSFPAQNPATRPSK